MTQIDKNTEQTLLAADKLQENTDLKNYFAPKISVNIPSNFSVKVRDYHEFDIIKNYFEEYLGIVFDYEEVGCDGDYEAVFFIGPKPNVIINKIKETYEN